MNYISVVIIAFTAMPILIGLLLGLLRGSRRSLLRLALVIVSVVLAFALCGVVSRALMKIDISSAVGAEAGESVTVTDYLQNMLLADMPEAVTDIVAIVMQSIFKVLVFLLLFGVFKFLTWAIVYPIFKIFIKPKTVKYSNGQVVKKKRRLIGMIFGALQGAVVALCVCVVFNGLLVQTNNVMMAVNDLQSVAGSTTQTVELEADDGDLSGEPNDGDEIEQDPDDGYTNEQPSDEGFEDMFALVNEYSQSAVGKFYSKIGGKAFDWLSEVKTDKGTFTLSGQVDAVRGVVKMAKELARLQDVQFGDLFAEGNIDQIQDIFNNLQEINKSLSKESKDTIKNVLEGLGEELGLPVDLSDIDFNEIDFAKEGEIFADLLEYKEMDAEDITTEVVEEMLDKIIESDLILDVLAAQGDNVDLNSQIKDADHVQAIEDKIADMESSGQYDQSKIDKLKSIFGIAD